MICHALDTAVVAEGLVDVLVGPHCRAELDRAFGPLGDAVGWVSVLCGVHDLGKLSPTFQGLREDIAAPTMGPVAAGHIRRLTRWRGPGARTDCHHGLLTAVHMTRILKAWGGGAGDGAHDRLGFERASRCDPVGGVGAPSAGGGGGQRGAVVGCPLR